MTESFFFDFTWLSFLQRLRGYVELFMSLEIVDTYLNVTHDDKIF